MRLSVQYLCFGHRCAPFIGRISPNRCARSDHSVTYVLSVTKCLTFPKVANAQMLGSLGGTIMSICQLVTQRWPQSCMFTNLVNKVNSGRPVHMAI
jgi:hypothetical protein